MNLMNRKRIKKLFINKMPKKYRLQLFLLFFSCVKISLFRLNEFLFEKFAIDFNISSVSLVDNNSSTLALDINYDPTLPALSYSEE